MNKPFDQLDLVPAQPVEAREIGGNLPPTKVPAVVPDNRKFDWNDDDSVVLHEQPETAIYWNPHGALVIRQRASWNEYDDPFVVVAANNVHDFLDRLTDICGIPSAGKRR